METCTIESSCPNNNLLLPLQDVTQPQFKVAWVLTMIFIRYSRSHVFLPLLRQLGARLGTATHGAKWVEDNKENIGHFSDFSFRFLFRCVVTGLGAYEYYHSPDYWQTTRLLWDGYPHVTSNAVQILYLLQLAYHVEDLGSVLIEGKSTRKDYAEMIIHHIVTALLLYGSALYSLTRIGVIVSTMHMITDVPKDFAKIAKTLEFKTASKVGLGIFVITWFVCRMYLYACVYVYSAFTETEALLEGGMTEFACNCFRFLLSSLIALNTLWTYMIIKLIIKVLTKGDAEDPQLAKKKKEAGEVKPSKSESDSTDVSDETSLLTDSTDTSAD